MKPGSTDNKTVIKVGAEDDREAPVISFISGKKESTAVDMPPIVPVQVSRHFHCYFIVNCVPKHFAEMFQI